MTELSVGDVLWRMRGRQKNESAPVEWRAVPICVEYVDDRKFLDSWGCGGSLGLIGKTYFLTREECLEDYRQRKCRNYLPPELPPSVKMGDTVPDTKVIDPEDKFVFVFCGIDRKRVPKCYIPWHVEKIGGDEFFHTTLGEIRDAVKEKLNTGFVTVVVEDGMHGEIYETGNYSGETAFRLHGETMGYW